MHPQNGVCGEKQLEALAAIGQRGKRGSPIRQQCDSMQERPDGAGGRRRAVSITEQLGGRGSPWRVTVDVQVFAGKVLLTFPPVEFLLDHVLDVVPPPKDFLVREV